MYLRHRSSHLTVLLNKSVWWVYAHRAWIGWGVMVVAIAEVDVYGMYCGLVPRAPELLHWCQGPCFACVPLILVPKQSVV